MSGAQPEVLPGEKGFLKLGYFDKHFVKKSRKKDFAGKQHNLETAFWMDNLTQGWTQSGPFSPKSGHSFQFLEKGRGDLSSCPLP